MKRGLSRDEAALWARLAGTVAPINPPRHGEGDRHAVGVERHHRWSFRSPQSATPHLPLHQPTAGPPPRSGEDLRTRPHTLDANWDRKLAQGLIQPDFTIDLHGHSLNAAHARLEHGLALAQAQGARMVLLITGKQRPGDGYLGRGERRGAIRAKFVDWLALGSHGGRIAAIRPAHPRHGGAGAVYLVLRKSR